MVQRLGNDHGTLERPAGVEGDTGYPAAFKLM
jgi:hypothetical protein